MKENKYDDAVFFEKYSQMERSKKGLEAAGEWESLRKLLPDFQGKRVLDLGCGYGWHCIYAMEHGAESAVGVDISEKMLETARAKTTFPQVEYRHEAMEDAVFEKEEFDVVISSLAMHYVQEFDAVVDKIYDALKYGGSFILSVEHPVFTAEGSQDWCYDDDGQIRHFPVDRYYYEGKRNAHFLGENVIKYHRTMTTYVNTLLQKGFELRELTEPQPPEKMLDIPGMRDEMRRPMMLLLSVVKKH